MNLVPDYTLIEGYRDNIVYRAEFFNFISKIFPGISFKEWYEKGFWTDDYIPFSLLDKNKIVSNVCAALMRVVIENKEYSAVQFGAVGTLPELRNNGLSKNLMNYAIEKLEPTTDIFFLYANESVLNFYPKFGFNNFDEYIFVKEVNLKAVNPIIRKLDLSNGSDYLILQNLLSNRISITNIFGAEEYQFITMWHILNIYRNDLYYFEKENVVIIMTGKNNQLSVIDVICAEKIDIDSIIPQLVHSQNISSITYSFPPDQLHYAFDYVEKYSSDLFVRGNIKLPEKSFRFPVTAIT